MERGGIEYLEAGIRLMEAATSEDKRTAKILERLGATYWSRYMVLMSQSGVDAPSGRGIGARGGHGATS